MAAFALAVLVPLGLTVWLVLYLRLVAERHPEWKPRPLPAWVGTAARFVRASWPLLAAMWAAYTGWQLSERHYFAVTTSLLYGGWCAAGWWRHRRRMRLDGS